MNLFATLRFFYYYTLFYWFRLAFFLGILTPPIRPKTFLEENKEYIEPLLELFKKTYENKSVNWNENIDTILYDKPKYTLYMSEPNTPLEQLWKTRVLFEKTPRGNIIMFYDAYKLGFSFYCDQKVISYDILNAAAMKYVRLFRCRDFFLDEEFVPNKSPLIAIHFDEKKNVLNVNIKKQNKLTKPNQIKPKSNVVSNWFFNKPIKDEPKEEKEGPEKMMNKFLYLGKIANYQMTQSMPKPRKVLAKFVSPVLESLGGQKMSFKDYKEWQDKQKQSST
jgi:hypothetical protein